MTQDANRLVEACNGVTISLNTMCKILRIGKPKARKLIGTKVRVIDKGNNRYECDLADILLLI